MQISQAEVIKLVSLNHGFLPYLPITFLIAENTFFFPGSRGDDHR
jgi:hypothetical protein